MPYDGVMNIKYNSSQYGHTYVNGTLVANGGSGSSYSWGITITVNFNKGDFIYSTVCEYAEVAYYKLRDYSNR